MDNIFGSFLNFHTAAFIVGCYALTWLTRRGVETGFPKLKPVKQNRTEKYLTEFARWWNSFILYLIPPTWGLALGYFLYPHLSWPKGFESLQAVLFLGLVCGWISGLVYKFLMKVLLKKLGVKDEDAEKALKEHEDEPKVAGEDDEEPEVEDEDTPEETSSSRGE